MSEWETTGNVSIEELARVFGFCLVCCDAGIVGARLDDCEHGEASTIETLPVRYGD